MEITVTEALRIKNEVSSAIKTLNYKIHSASFGITKEDGVVTSRDEDSFLDVEKSLIKGLTYSEELNNSISMFNKKLNVDTLVRKMQNSKLLLEVYTRNLGKTKPTINKRFENLGTVRQSIEVVFSPYISSKDMKEKISKEKKIIREIQSEIEKLNQNTINVNFEYSDIESLIN